VEKYSRPIPKESEVMTTNQPMTAAALRGVTVRPPVLASTNVFVRLPDGELTAVESAFVDVQKTEDGKDAAIRIILEIERFQ